MKEEIMKAVLFLEADYPKSDDMPSSIFEAWTILNELLEDLA